jgi:hypothetical protein
MKWAAVIGAERRRQIYRPLLPEFAPGELNRDFQVRSWGRLLLKSGPGMFVFPTASP